MTIDSEFHPLRLRSRLPAWASRIAVPAWLLAALLAATLAWLSFPYLTGWLSGSPAPAAAGLTPADRVSSGKAVAVVAKPEAAPEVAPASTLQQQPKIENIAAVADETPATQPVAHARNAAVRTCLPALQELSLMVIDGGHVAFSTWNNAAANDRLFQSVAGLKYDNKNAPVGLSILLAAPVRGEKCDGATVQIQPSALPCDRIAKNLTDAQLAATDLNGIRMVEATKSTRVVLLPTRGNGCAVVGVGVHYAR